MSESVLLESEKLRALYTPDDKGVLPIHVMQQHLIQVTSLAAIVAVMAYALHNDEKKGIKLDHFVQWIPHSNEKITFQAGETIEQTITGIIQKTYASKRFDTFVHHYAELLNVVQPEADEFYTFEELPPYMLSSSQFPVPIESMRRALNNINKILQSHLQIVVAPGEGFKNFNTALTKLENEKKYLSAMTDLARITVLFNDYQISEFFSIALGQVAKASKELESNPCGVTGCEPLEERLQKSGYLAKYGYLELNGQRCEVQLCHEVMAGVYSVTHALYEIERYLDGKDKQSLSSEDLKKLMQSAVLELNSFEEQIGNITHPWMQDDTPWFIKGTYAVMNFLGREQPEKIVIQTFNKQRQELEKIASSILTTDCDDASQELKEMILLAWTLRQSCHLVSVFGQTVDPQYRKSYTDALVNKLPEIMESSLDSDGEKPGLFLYQQLQLWGIIKPDVIKPSNFMSLCQLAGNHL